MIQTRTDITAPQIAPVQRQSLTEIVVVCACDDAYAMPLAVMLHSAAMSLRTGQCLNVYLLDGGISETNWMALRETLVDLPISVTSVKPDFSSIQELDTSHHVTLTAYLRLLTGRLLPTGIEKALYLDPDIVVLDDLGKLWCRPLGDNYCLAAPDIACPYVDAKSGCANFRRASPYLASLRPIPNFKQLRLDGAAEYFNSGVMVLNLALWRQDDVAERMLSCLEENKEHVWCWDQYALNVVFHKRWGRLPLRWNVGAHSLDIPTLAHSPVDRIEYRETLENPAIVHFTTEFKPWHYHWSHLRGDLFFQALDRTAYRGWRPEKPVFNMQQWWQRQIVSFIKRATINYRQVASIWS